MSSSRRSLVSSTVRSRSYSRVGVGSVGVGEGSRIKECDKNKGG